MTVKVPHPYAATNTRTVTPIGEGYGAIEVDDPRRYADGSSGLADVRWSKRCGRELDACGGRCCLAAWHVVPCECGGDRPGEPGTCPA